MSDFLSQTVFCLSDVQGPWGQRGTMGSCFVKGSLLSLQQGCKAFTFVKENGAGLAHTKLHVHITAPRSSGLGFLVPSTLTLPLNQKATAYEETLSPDTVKTQAHNIDRRLTTERLWVASPLIYRAQRVLWLKSFDLISSMR